ncbi:hypothetical protein GCK32_014622 [Trichostrongylus colubriformis]|uniref:Uncharacterized protein n=1 Tax=Trichostrongylus colubriformis TaxID=6319 RepID=A0AAN8FLQ1_TRICO
MVRSERFVCCSAVPMCIQGDPEMYLIGRVKRCSSTSDCGRGFSCTESNVNGVTVCCSLGAVPMGDISESDKVNVARIDDMEWVIVEG